MRPHLSKEAIKALSEKHSLRAERVYALLLGMFLAALLTTNVITSKYFTIFGFPLTAGSLTYPFTFMLVDIISELYGKSKAKLAVWIGFIGSSFMTIGLTLASLTHIHPESPVSQGAFQSVFGFAPGILLGSMAA